MRCRLTRLPARWLLPTRWTPRRVFFGIGQHPKGDKDPFALRRAALGVLRIIVEKNLNLDLQTLTEEAVRLYGEKLTNANVVDDVIDFMLGRFRARYQDEGYGVDTIQAVLARRPTRPADFDARMKAVSHFRTLEESSAHGGGKQARIQHPGEIRRDPERYRSCLGAERSGGN